MASVLRPSECRLLEATAASGALGRDGLSCSLSYLQTPPRRCSPASTRPGTAAPASTSGRYCKPPGRGGVGCAAASSHRDSGFDWKNPLGFLFPADASAASSADRTSRYTTALSPGAGGTKSASLGWAPWREGELDLVSVLGHGSYGTVYFALDRASKREVAVKRQDKTRKRLDVTKVLKKINREVDIMRELQACPQTARLYFTREDEDSTYMVMEVLRGGTLADLMAAAPNGRLNEAEVIHTCRGVLKFVAACHDRGVLYGDIKPANFIHDAGILGVRAVDFGCAQKQSSSDVYFKSRCGTPAYFAPEVFRKCFTLEADLWSLGMMMYVFVTGRFPWWDDMSVVSPKEVEDRVMYHTVPFVDKEWETVSPAMRDLVERLLEKNPAQRITAEQALAHPVMNGQRVVTGPPQMPRAEAMEMSAFRSISASDEDTDCSCAAA
eukprot:jgi/Tetstr1/465872/TSEL_010489.t1